MWKRTIHRVLSPERRRALRFAARRLRHLGWRRYCPVCDSRCRAFLADPRTGRPDAGCPVCDSRERHRSIWPFLMGRTPLPSAELRVLHVAPEPGFELRLRRFPLLDYVTCDLSREDVDFREDLTKLSFADGRFDFVICNHVLEHVADDAAAMREMFRVLSPGGFAEISVPGPSASLGHPARLEATIEDPSVTTPEERRRRYGHPGHVRQYGSDLAERLRSAGFEVQVTSFGPELSPGERQRLGIPPSYPIYWCRKPAPPLSPRA
ncbi:MAG: class I SAM-dependent methyltransferase [Myxococcota bacterium]|nr:class I SAM-dependent methyltransferase [Myxococcota bacterium]